MPSDSLKLAANHDQQEFWSSEFGQKWVVHQQKLDTLFTEIKENLLARCDVRAGESVLDIGCGTGETTLALAASVGADGKVLGADISPTLLSLAKDRVFGIKNVNLVQEDAQMYRFEPEAFDLLASRFGLMFFADPVAAFSNLASALCPGGRAVFVTWDAPQRNPWSFLTKRAAIAQLGDAPVEPKRAPGQFAFAETDYVLEILSATGFTQCQAETLNLFLHIEGTPEDAAELATNIGPVSRLMNEYNGTEDDRLAIAAATTKAFAPFAVDGAMRVPARVHYFTAVKA
ncbi:class I SAM-dependent methyltransferase [Pseudohalocynthiibacter aestuariivivens]|jgi:SAM-dependent methyltransferase|uniref:Class I SAM-dependent methyltransferase n=1 Tax=Pseudohalocynthiibacter aestuariivivens TaxID=1591409 RepID=A0ABV5JCJ2_9RHOB|nr:MULTISPECIES: methyltransferase domain-containing protein [Pseudohalocynthiibacter]MBS9718607.1 methyltransferase domain-containing protein [Pseudohalocynthiibacter aestuariivivens]MCK0103618.1 methyltransferase domain-containing protein [Pseudohalocynthiibacter sp. F2068]